MSKKQLAKLPNGIVGIEKTTNAIELAEIYSASDVFVNPTYEDTYPTVNIEAQACGTPVVSYDTGGSKESAIIYGSICNKGDILGLTNLIYKWVGKNN